MDAGSFHRQLVFSPVVRVEKKPSGKVSFLDQILPWAVDLAKREEKAHCVVIIILPIQKRTSIMPKEKKWVAFSCHRAWWLSKWFESGFHDSYRHLYPDKIEYSWWSVRFNSEHPIKDVDRLSIGDGPCFAID